MAYAAVKERRFVNRGFLNGPICPIYGVGVSVVLYFLTPAAEHMVLLYIASTVLVTVLEGLTGYFMDKIFHHKWWDYSNQPLNIGGYVCLLFSLVWGVACVAIVKVIHPLIHGFLAMIPRFPGMVLITVLMIVLFADLYVTASAILKLNRQLEMMEKIAEELHELSDKMGETIYENVMETMEIKEEGRKRLEEAAAERKAQLEEAAAERKAQLEEAAAEGRMRLEALAAEQRQKGKKRMEELRARYEELSGQRTRVARRLLTAFPRMESRKHKAILEELKIKMKGRL